MGFEIILVYVLMILSSIACVVYGIINWNKGADVVTEEDKHWVEEEKKIEQEFE